MYTKNCGKIRTLWSRYGVTTCRQKCFTTQLNQMFDWLCMAGNHHSMNRRHKYYLWHPRQAGTIIWSTGSRSLYAELKKAKHERNGSHRLLTSTSKTLKLLRSEKNNLLYAKLMYSHLSLGLIFSPNFYIASRTQRILQIMNHCLPSPANFHPAHEDGAEFINFQELHDGLFNGRKDVDSRAQIMRGHPGHEQKDHKKAVG